MKPLKPLENSKSSFESNDAECPYLEKRYVSQRNLSPNTTVLFCCALGSFRFMITATHYSTVCKDTKPCGYRKAGEKKGESIKKDIEAVWRHRR